MQQIEESATLSETAVDLGIEMHGWAAELYPICRSLTGPGVRETLSFVQGKLAGLEVHSVPSGTEAFDWTVPDEWSVREAWIEDPSGRKVVDFKDHNLHLVGYSEPIDLWLDLEELQPYLHSLPQQPEAIPYVTSYYKRGWGFCLSHRQRENLQEGRYHVFIDSELKPGVLNYGELVILGATEQEVFLSTYICHPSMANNELSGPVVTAALGRWLLSLPRRHYTYRIVFIPETIGSLVYLSRHLDHLKSHVVAGFNVSCVGDERCYSYLPSRAGDTLSDRVAVHVLQHIDPEFIRYPWLQRGSDERQYCAPGIDLPVATIARSKYATYPEYHTSLDDLDFVTPAGLAGGFEALRTTIKALEANCRPVVTVLGEPQLGKRRLWPATSGKGYSKNLAMWHLISYADGRRDLIEIADIIGVPVADLVPIVDVFVGHDLLRLDR